MKIVFCSHSSGTAGAERSLLATVMEARDRGHTGAIVTPRAAGALAELATQAWPEFGLVTRGTHRWMSQRNSGLIGAIRLFQCVIDVPAYYLLFRTFRPDVVVVGSAVIPGPMLAAFLARIPCVTCVAESIDTNPTLKSLLPKAAIKRVIRRLSWRVVCVSKYVRNQFPSSDVIIVPSIGAPKVSDRVDAEHQHQPRTCLKVLVVGTISAEKGQIQVVRALRKLADSGTRFIADFHGSGSRASINAFLNEVEINSLRSRIVWHGETADLSCAFECADVSVVYSGNEAFGRVTVESLLHAVPVIGLARGGTEEILALGGGVLVNGSEGLVEALQRLAGSDDALKTLQSAARRNQICRDVQVAAARFVQFVEALRPPDA